MVGPGTFLDVVARRVSRVSVIDEQHLAALDAPGPAVIVVNHTTAVDVIVVLGTLHKLGFTSDGPCEGECTHRRHIRPMGTSDLWNFTITRKVCTGSGVIPVDQHDGRAAYKAARDALKDNECILIYPEGDVKVNDEASPREWRPGAVGLARTSKAVVVPIAHHDTRELGAGPYAKAIRKALMSFIRRPRIALRIGTPIYANDFADLSPAECDALMQNALKSTWISATHDYAELN